MIRPLIAIAAIAALSAAAADAAPSKRGGQGCFFTRSVTSFAAQSEQVVNVRVGVRDVYRLELLGPCHDVQWPLGIALVSKGGGAICSPLDAEIVFRSEAFGPQRCPVQAMRKLTPQEVAALPKKARP